jgi:nucleoside-diphosphate-sugar epimerase
MEPRVAVVGASGFLGGELLRQCCSLGWSVAAVHHRHAASHPGNVESLSWHDWLGSTERHLDAVFYCASVIPYGRLDEPDRGMLDTNALQLATVHQRFPAATLVYPSSVSVYRASSDEIRETSAVEPQNLYAHSKLAGESIARFFERWRLIRLSSIYGRHMNPATFIPRVIAQARNTGRIPIWGDGHRLQNYIHVRDAAMLCIRAYLHGSHEVYLGVGGRSYSNLEVAQIVAGRCGAAIEHTGEDESPSWTFDAQYSYRTLGVTPKEDFTQQLEAMCHDT